MVGVTDTETRTLVPYPSQVQATDADKGVNGQVKYSIVQQPNQKGTKFTVDEETGEIFTNKVPPFIRHTGLFLFRFSVLSVIKSTRLLCIVVRNIVLTSFPFYVHF